jgi:hypothetical protein
VEAPGSTDAVSRARTADLADPNEKSAALPHFFFDEPIRGQTPNSPLCPRQVMRSRSEIGI